MSTEPGAVHPLGYATDGQRGGDFPLPDGTTAQQYLRRYPSDPSKLDSDHDDHACEP